MKISIVIPAYNEEKRIEKTLNKILSYLKKKHDYEIIIVDDGSADRTSEIISGFKDRKIRILQNSRNMGKGYSVKRGVLKARYPLILFSDSDLSTPIEEMEKMIKEIKNYDIVIASRNLKDSNILQKQPFFRNLPGKIFSVIANTIVPTGIKDTQCGFKLFRRNTARKIFKKQTINRWGFDVEILYIAKRLGYKIKEVPVTWINSKASKLNVFKDSISMFLELLRIRFNSLKGMY